ncbi:MAG: hypothetical protein HYU98_04945, partial [Deltaproteobacteria bacterium]|nr:hypothetical protein [Deltaproteobacteria bacterium]
AAAAAAGAPVDTYVDATAVTGGVTAARGGAPAVSGLKKTSVKHLQITSTPAEIREVAEAFAALIKSPHLTADTKNKAEQMRIAGEVYGQATMLFQLGNRVRETMIAELGRLVGSPASLQLRLDLADEISHKGKAVFTWKVAVDSNGAATDLIIESTADSALTDGHKTANAVAEKPVEAAGQRTGETAGGTRKRAAAEGKEAARKKPAPAKRAETPLEKLKRLFTEHRDLIDFFGRVEEFNRLLEESPERVAGVFRNGFPSGSGKRGIFRYFLPRLIQGGIGGDGGLPKKELPKAVAIALAAPQVKEAEKARLIENVRRIMTIAVTAMLKPELGERGKELVDLVTRINNLPPSQWTERIPELLPLLPAQKVLNALGDIAIGLERAFIICLFGEQPPSGQVADEGRAAVPSEGKPEIAAAETVALKASAPKASLLQQEDADVVKKIADNLRIIAPIVESIGRLAGTQVTVLSKEAVEKWRSQHSAEFNSFISARKGIYQVLESVLLLHFDRQNDIIRALCSEMKVQSLRLGFMLEKLNLLVPKYDASYTIVLRGKEWTFNRRSSVWSRGLRSAASAAPPKGSEPKLVEVLRTNFPKEMAGLSPAEAQRLADGLTREFFGLSNSERAAFGRAGLGEIPLAYLRARVGTQPGAMAEGVEGAAARRERYSEAGKERGREGRDRAEERTDQSRQGEVK